MRNRRYTPPTSKTDPSTSSKTVFFNESVYMVSIVSKPFVYCCPCRNDLFFCSLPLESHRRQFPRTVSSTHSQVLGTHNFVPYVVTPSLWYLSSLGLGKHYSSVRMLSSCNTKAVTLLTGLRQEQSPMHTVILNSIRVYFLRTCSGLKPAANA